VVGSRGWVIDLRFIATTFVLCALGLGLAPLLLFVLERGGAVWPEAYVLKILRFTVWQAALSTLLSVLPAIVAARALARRQFKGRQALLAFLAVPQSLPVIVAILGLTSLYGTNGLLSRWISLYGLPGILLAHVFFNLPLATRLLLAQLETAPPEAHRLATQLGFSEWVTFKQVDWPALKSVLPQVSALIFLLCAGSFVIVLVFGGPAATTLEVAIYQSLRMDFDVSRALTLSLLQILLSSVFVFLAAGSLSKPEPAAQLREGNQRYDGANMLARIVDIAAILVTSFIVAPLLIAIVVYGLPSLTFSMALLVAFLTSLAIGLASMACTLPLAWGLAKLPASPLKSVLALSGYIVPPAVLATGWFLATQPYQGIPLAIGLIIVMNVLMALPFVMTLIAPAIVDSIARNDKLCTQLGLKGWQKLWRIDVMSIRGVLAQAAVMAFVLSLGDLTAITLLGTQGLVTLPSLVQSQLGHYQSQEAGGTALVLAAICLALTALAQRFSRWT
jgi:thiamine transport system permease protein